MGDIFREVDEELKQERYEKLWREYRWYIIGAAVVIVAVVAGRQAWNEYQTSQRYAEGKRFTAAAALLLDGKTTEAANAFSGLAQNTSSGYGVLSRFYQASIAAKAGDTLHAIEIYDRIADDSGVPNSMRQLAAVLATFQALKVSSISGQTIRDRIQPMTGAGKPYRHVALEILALTAQRDGDADAARANYQAIVDDPKAATGIRTRAAQMLNILSAS
ncbi:MAG: tetratricopeptide repeat protein [Pseudomonadota bacterium]|nr:tetratricopeptide repeat protein [Pseudomonadota bacterium]